LALLIDKIQKVSAPLFCQKAGFRAHAGFSIGGKYTVLPACQSK